MTNLCFTGKKTAGSVVYLRVALLHGSIMCCSVGGCNLEYNIAYESKLIDILGVVHSILHSWCTKQHMHAILCIVLLLFI